MGSSIRSKMLYCFMIPVTVIYIITVTISIYALYRATSQRVEQDMSKLAKSYADRFDSHLRQVSQVARTTATFIENLPKMTEEQIYDQLSSNVMQSSLIYGGVICYKPYSYDSDVRLFCPYVYRGPEGLKQMDVGVEGFDYTDPYDYTKPSIEWWNLVLERGEALWTEPYFDEGAGNILMCTYSAPFFKDGEILGVTTVDIPLRDLRELTFAGLEENVKFEVITQKGKVVYSTYPEAINTSFIGMARERKRPDLIELAEASLSGGTGVRKMKAIKSDQKQWFFYAGIESTGWGFFMHIEDDAILKDVRDSLVMEISLSLFGLVILAGMIWIVSVNISKPILMLTDASLAMAGGDLEHELRVDGDDEIAVLGDSFKMMRNSIKEQMETIREKNAELYIRGNELERSRGKYKTLVESINDLIWEVDAELRYSYLSPKISGLLGYEPDEMLGKTPFEFMNASESERVLEELKKSLENKEPFQQIENSSIHKNGSVVVFETSGVPIFDDNGGFLGYRGVTRDITDRKEVENERDRLLKSLSVKNEDLESIVYVSSHDLRSPLVNIQGHSSELANCCKEIKEAVQNEGVPEQIKTDVLRTLDEEILPSLNFVVSSTDKMDILLNGLLKLCRLGRASYEIQEVDMNSMFKGVVSSMQYQIDKSGMEVQIEELPSCMGDQWQVSQVFTNLVDNAIKYRSQGKEGLVRVFGYIENEMSVYCVEDNGVGISKEDQKKVFEIFHRVDPHSSVSGDGLGLSIVQRIIDRLDGRIWLESELGEGSKFFVALPKGNA